MYLSVTTRPDIAYAVGTLARLSSKPNKEHWTALKRVCAISKELPNMVFSIARITLVNVLGTQMQTGLEILTNRKSTSVYVFQISGAPVTWRSKKQACVALSTAEARICTCSSF